MIPSLATIMSNLHLFDDFLEVRVFVGIMHWAELGGGDCLSQDRLIVGGNFRNNELSFLKVEVTT
jgi:hypothetical protein